MAGQNTGSQLSAPDAAEARFRAYLSRHSLKYTRERRAILRAVMQDERHFEAEELLLTMRAQGLRVAQATIYRTLPLLVACGIIREVIFGEKHAHYEHTFGHTGLIDAVCSAAAFQPRSHRFQITGLCPACLRRQSPAPDDSST